MVARLTRTNDGGTASAPAGYKLEYSPGMLRVSPKSRHRRGRQGGDPTQAHIDDVSEPRYRHVRTRRAPGYPARSPQNVHCKEVESYCGNHASSSDLAVRLD